ncbi:MAG: hypothetical protein WB245_11010, partial [Acidimicrobiia bacterium]
MFAMVLLVGCQGSAVTQGGSTTTSEATTTVVPVETTTTIGQTEPTLPPVVGPDPSYRVAAFYYP